MNGFYTIFKVLIFTLSKTLCLFIQVYFSSPKSAKYRTYCQFGFIFYIPYVSILISNNKEGDTVDIN
ncbi:hypothetical protein BpHYR1_020479 [Brachionus plicatilis]|uniref:Uncharacterized protein n=1 Tax=Brachionus plicatilis TaxID=10195 RepID=A0A3M7Q3A7_BRAPC|nr:hypothetical protein BpHYR1_020479 [Brachionus plicatilis]